MKADDTLVLLTYRTFERLRSRVMAARLIAMPPLRAKPTAAGTILALTVSQIVKWKYLHEVQEIACPIVLPTPEESSGPGESEPSESEPSSPGGPGEDSDKTAIVPVTCDDGTVEWVQWVCAERPEAIFEEVMTLTLAGHGRAAQPLPRELVQSCEPGSLRAVHAQPLGALARATARVQRFADGAWWLLAEVAPVRGGQMPGQVRVRLEGKRRGGPPRWQRMSAEQARRNEAFWAAARAIEIR